MGNKAVNLRQVLRRLILVLVGGTIIVFGMGYVYPEVIFPVISEAPWPVHLFFGLTVMLPISSLVLYLMYRFALFSTVEMPIKSLRGWVIASAFILCYSYSWVLLAFLFETFTPFLPGSVKGVTLPFIISMIPLIIISRTRLRPKFERFFKRLIKENSNK